jgi:hypothetical protein
MWHSILCHDSSYVWDLVRAHLVIISRPGFGPLKPGCDTRAHIRLTFKWTGTEWWPLDLDPRARNQPPKGNKPEPPYFRSMAKNPSTHHTVGSLVDAADLMHRMGTHYLILAVQTGSNNHQPIFFPSAARTAVPKHHPTDHRWHTSNLPQARATNPSISRFIIASARQIGYMGLTDGFPLAMLRTVSRSDAEDNPKIPAMKLSSTQCANGLSSAREALQGPRVHTRPPSHRSNASQRPSSLILMAAARTGHAQSLWWWHTVLACERHGKGSESQGCPGYLSRSRRSRNNRSWPGFSPWR